ncbi:MAG: hypothetical protein JWQ38_1372 [Flavipsychrobacter sp.]|nr:hypothetical protein [Flavipsychrobacter sp.]
MYQFRIKSQEDGGYRFELDNINIISEGYIIENGQHVFTNPNKAIAYFNVENNIYGVSNDPLSFFTAEAFYDAIKEQYNVFTDSEMKHTA